MTGRVLKLERRVDELANRTTDLERDQKDTRKLVEDLEASLNNGLDTVTEKLETKIDAQTEQLQDQINSGVRQWPATAIAIVSASLALVVGWLLGIISAAEHLFSGFH